MRRATALASVLAVCAALILSGCRARDVADRVEQSGRPGVSSTDTQATAGTPEAPADAQDVGTVDAELAEIDALLSDVDGDLTEADRAPDDAD